MPSQQTFNYNLFYNIEFLGKYLYTRDPKYNLLTFIAVEV